MTPAVAAARTDQSEIRRRPAGRKTMIVTATRRLAADRGLAAVSMEDIAAELNMTAGALYRHFPGKAGIAEAVKADTVERFVAATEGSRTATVERTLDPTQALGALVASMVELSLDDPTLLRVYTRQRGAGEVAPTTIVERRLVKLWTDAVLAARPDLPRAHARVRQAAVLGALAATTWRSGPISRQALDVLLSHAATAVLLSPVIPATPPIADGLGRPSGGWRPEPSRRDEILAAALSLFRANGFAGTAVDDIGQAVNLSGSGIYRSYQTKADILLDAYDRAQARVEIGAERALESASSPLDAVRRLARSYATVAMDNTDLIVVTGRENSALPAQERPRLARQARAIRDAWAGVLREARAGLSEPEARLLYRGAWGLANQAALSSKQNQVEAGEIAAMMLAFLLADPTDPRPTDAK